MLKKMQKSACALAVLAVTATSALATESVDLKVIGTITPEACTPTLTGGGVVDYGTIKAATLEADSFNVLATKQMDLSISCDAPVKVALKSINNRPDTVAGAAEGAGGAAVAPVALLGANDMPVVGLGLEGEVKVGGYALTLSDSLTDGVAADLLTQSVGSSTWDTSANKALFSSTSSVITSWGEAGTTAPVAFETMSGKLNVQAYLNKGSELDLTKPVNLDGMSTLELYYL